MKQLVIVAVALSLLATGASASDLIITGVIDGPLTGGLPKAIELIACADIADLSIYGIEAANNGAPSAGPEYTLPAVSAVEGQFIYVSYEAPGFLEFFGFDPDYLDNVANINGDDAIVLFMDGTAVDVFGEVGVDGTGEPWEHLDGWAYRIDETGPDGDTFVLASWFFSGPNALDGETSNATAAVPFPIGTYDCVGASPVESTTWGMMKALYR